MVPQLGGGGGGEVRILNAIAHSVSASHHTSFSGNLSLILLLLFASFMFSDPFLSLRI